MNNTENIKRIIFNNCLVLFLIGIYKQRLNNNFIIVLVKLKVKLRKQKLTRTLSPYLFYHTFITESMQGSEET